MKKLSVPCVPRPHFCLDDTPLQDDGRPEHNIQLTKVNKQTNL